MFKNSIKIISILIIGLFFIFTVRALCISDFNQYVFAVVNGEYNRNIPPGGPDSPNIVMQDWNYLDDDFLLRDGTNVNSDLDMLDDDGTSRHKIINLDTNSGVLSDLVNVNYVNSNISSAQGGDTYINWGRSNCSGSDDLMYSGYAFATGYSNVSGSSNPVCVDSSDWGSFFNSSKKDKLVPLTTGDNSLSPVSIPGRSFIKCAVCYRKNSTCFENYGSHDCGSFNQIYGGYVMSMVSDMSRNATERGCLNENFESDSPIMLWGAIWYGSRLQENFGENDYSDCVNDGNCNFLKCSICCN